MTETLFTRTVASPVGDLTLLASDVGLCGVLWPNDGDRVRFHAELVDAPDHELLRAAAAQLDEYFAGQREVFELPLDLRGTEFEISVWRALADVPFGHRSTYGEQAARIGRPRAVRAVGAANGRNPVSIVLPCHRIVGKDGSLTGFAGGLDAKRYLLDHELGQRRLVP